MSTEEIYEESGYKIPKDETEESSKQFDYWDMIGFAELVASKNEIIGNVSNCDSDTKDLIEHTKRVLDLIKSKSGIAVKVLSNRVNKKLEQLK